MADTEGSVRPKKLSHARIDDVTPRLFAVVAGWLSGRAEQSRSAVSLQEKLSVYIHF